MKKAYIIPSIDIVGIRSIPLMEVSQTDYPDAKQYIDDSEEDEDLVQPRFNIWDE